MKQASGLRSSLLCGIAVALALVVVAQLTRVSGFLAPSPFEPGARKVYELSNETRVFLEELAQIGDEILLTYYASPHSTLPSRLRHLRKEVELVLSRIAEASGGHVHLEVVVPDEHPELREYLTELGLSSFRARSVEQDGWSEADVWSSLRISRGAAPDAILHAVTPELVRGLQNLVVEQARALATREALRAHVTLAAPQGEFKKLELLLKQSADVTRINLDAEPASLPRNSDLLFWMNPEGASPEHFRALDQHLLAGRPAVLATDAYSGSAADQASEAIYARYGVSIAPGALSDTEFPSYLLRPIAQDQDFRPLGAQPNGSLVFDEAKVLGLDQRRLAELGRNAHTLVSASRTTEVLLGQTAAPAPRSPLLLLVTPDNSQQGALVLSATSVAFDDFALGDNTSANRGLVRILVEELASPGKLVSNRAFVPQAEPIAQLSSHERDLWRAITILFIPAAWLWFALLRLRKHRSSPTRTARPLLVGLGVGLIVAASASLLARSLELQFDSTADRVHSISTEEQQVIERAIAGGEHSRIELFFSPASELPPELRLPVRRTRDLCEQLARHVSGLSIGSPSLDETRGDERLSPRLITSQHDESTRVRRVVAALRIWLGSESSVLQLTDATDYENLRFRIAFAFWRLSEQRPIRVAMAVEEGRLSAAEDELDYRSEGLFAPTDADQFAHARELLARNDFELVSLDPGAPAPPNEPDLILWLGPQRDISPMLQFTTGCLANGGSALIAAQHYEILPRQLRRDEMELSFWPRPKHNDLERDYFPGLGIELTREIFFDRESAPVTLPTRIERRLEQSGGGHELESQFSAQPFIVRGLASNFGAHPITGGLGDILMPSPNKFDLNEEHLAEYDLKATRLINSTENVWHHDWTGGNLDPALLRGPVSSADNDMPFERRLAVLFEGRFPAAQFKRERLPNGSESNSFVPGSPHDGASGKLLFAGSSSMFEDAAIANPDFDNGQFLLHSVINLTLGDELTKVASRRLAISGFESPSPEKRLWWRLFALGSGPLAGLLLALWLSAARRRSARARISPQ